MICKGTTLSHQLCVMPYRLLQKQSIHTNSKIPLLDSPFSLFHFKTNSRVNNIFDVLAYDSRTKRVAGSW